VVAGPDTGKVFTPTQETISIGRGEDCDVVLRDGAVSRRHCAIQRSNQKKISLSDLYTPNGTFLNDVNRRIQTCDLQSGDEIIIGKSWLQVELVEEGQAAQRSHDDVPPQELAIWHDCCSPTFATASFGGGKTEKRERTNRVVRWSQAVLCNDVHLLTQMRKARLAMSCTNRWLLVCLMLLGMCTLSCSSTRSRPSPPMEAPLPKVREPSPRVVPPTALTPQSDPVVRQIQGILQERGYAPGPLDGVLGKKTRAALRRFQRDHRLSVTGEIDAATKSVLLSPQPSPSESVREGETY
jgi:predicted component of type VI protein secretion system